MFFLSLKFISIHNHTELKHNCNIQYNPRDQFFEGDILSPDNKHTVKTKRRFLMLYENIFVKNLACVAGTERLERWDEGGKHEKGNRSLTLSAQSLSLFPFLPIPYPFLLHLLRRLLETKSTAIQQLTCHARNPF